MFFLHSPVLAAYEDQSDVFSSWPDRPDGGSRRQVFSGEGDRHGDSATVEIRLLFRVGGVELEVIELEISDRSQI